MTGLALAFAAGLLSILSPCVLPLVPIVLGAAVTAHRLGALALAAGLAVSFTGLGLLLALAGFGLGVSWWDYLLTQSDALVLYLRQSVWPHPLVLDYGTAVVRSLAAVWWQSLVVLALLAATVAAVYDRRSSVRAFGFVGAWFFLILAPSSSIVPLVTQTIAEHRMYLPLAAVLISVVLAAHHFLQSRARLVLAAVALVCGGLTLVRSHDYDSELTLWQDNVAHRPHARVLTALGVTLLHTGRPAEALPLFVRAFALDPSYFLAQRNRALALLQLGRADEATAIFTALPGREPGEAEEYFALGNAFAREQKFAEAAAAYARTIALEPTHAAAHANLGNVFLLQGHARDAIVEYETVLRLRPDDARARENLALALESLR